MKARINKFLILFTVLLFCFGQMWADSETVPKTTDNWTGTSCSLTHAECANGSANAKKDGDASDVTYIKFRTNKNGNTMTFEVNEGYKVTGFSIRGYANDNSKAVELASVKYDSADPIAVSESFPNKNAGTTYTYSNTSDEATSAIVLSFGTNAGTQIMAVITITYEETGSGGGCTTPTDPAISGTTAYTEGENISLTASATGAASATFTWYKGADWATASAGSSVGTGATLSINSCATTDAGTYWCNISNGTGCEVQVSKAITVSAAAAVCPSGISISGTAAYTEGQTISLNAALSEGNGEITYTWYKGVDLTTAKAAGSIGTGTSFSKASCTTSDAGNYFCVATKDACSDAESTAYAVTVEEKTCPTSGQLYSAVTTATSNISIATTDGLELNSSTHKATVSGGKMYVISKQSSAKNLITNGAFCQTNNDTYFKVELDCALEEGDVISINVGKDGSNDRGVWVSTATSRPSSAPACALTAKSSSLTPKTYVVTSTDEYVGKKVFYIYRATGNSTYFNNVVITRPYSVLYDNLKEAIHTMPAKAVEFTLQELTNATFNHTGWTADKLVKVGGADKAAGTALGKTDVVTLTDNTTFTATWEAKVTKYTVTYYDGEAIEANKLGSELVNEGSNPTATGIVAPHKLGYSFAGWSTTNGGAVAALNTIVVADDMPLYAVYNAVNCSALSGKIFEVNINVAPAANCTIRSGSGYETSADLIKYGTVSGGIAIAENSSTSNHLIITTTPTIKFAGGNGYVHISFDCALKVGDKIKTTIASQNIAYTTTNTRNTANYFTKGTDQELTITSGHPLENATEIYLWAASSNGGELTSLEVIRPEKFEVTFNMHDHGDAVDPQYVIDGGKVTEPATTDITGWDFGGWFKESTYDNEWDFDNDVVTAATELHAKWTEHVLSNNVALGTLTVNGEDVVIVPSQLVYAVELPFGTTAIPTVAATAADANAKACNVTQASAVDGSATIYVKAEDNTTEATYTINFSVATSKDIELVWDKSKERCDATKPDANVLIAAMSQYLSASYTGSAAEGGSLTTGKTTGSKIIITAKPGYAFKAMGFYGKIEDGTCSFYNDGVVETIGTTTGDACYANVFSNDEVHEFVIELTGSNGVYIRNMQLTMIEACTPITLAWDEEPVEFEVGKAGYAIAATANNGGTITYATADNTIIDANASTGALTIAGLGSVALSASTPEGDGTTYCANGGDPIVLSKVVNTYYLVAFDGQNGEAADEVKYFSGDAAIAQPTDPSFPGHTFQGWFDAASAGNPVVFPLTPSASRTIYAQWVADCDGATITTQPVGASYLTGRTAAALVCEATAGAGGALTYEWFTCDDAMRTNPVAATATPSTAVAGTFYYFCKVTEEGCAVEAFSDVVTITVADKTPICLIATTVTGATAHGAVTGFLGEDRGGSADVNVTSSSYKMDKGKYIGVTLPEGYTFQEGDKVVLNVKTVNNATGFTLFDGKDGEKNLIIDTRDGALVPAGANTVVLPAYAGSQSVYVLRENNDATGDLNSAIDAIAVYRACSPILNKVTVNGAEGKPNALNQVVFEVAASTSQSQLEAIAFDWVSNDDAWTAAHAPVAANAWEFGVANEVTFTDKDGDQSVYTITVNKAAASTNVELATLTVDGNAITVVPGQDVYEYEYPYGTAETPAPVVAATAEDANAEVGTITQAASKNGTATFTVTAEDGITSRDYTINISISRIQAVVIYDGSTMTDITTKTGSDPTGFSWSMGSNVASTGDNVAGTWQGKNYTHAIKGFKANANTNNLVSFVVPEGYLAKVRLTGSTNSNGSERKMFIAKEATNDASKAIENYVITSSTYDAQGFVTEYMLPGTYYLGSTDSYRLFEFSVQLYPIDYTRAVTEGRLGTICLPNGGIMVGADIFEIAYYGGTSQKIFFDQIVNGVMEAGVPYVFLPKEGVSALAVTYTDAVNAPAGDRNGLYGSYTKEELPTDGSCYILLNNQYCQVLSAENYVGANKAYFKLEYITPTAPALAPGRIRMSIGAAAPQVATGIDQITNDQLQMTDKVIINGQLFILRGEKMYDATGRLVK